MRPGSVEGAREGERVIPEEMEGRVRERPGGAEGMGEGEGSGAEGQGRVILL